MQKWLWRGPMWHWEWPWWKKSCPGQDVNKGVLSSAYQWTDLIVIRQIAIIGPIVSGEATGKLLRNLLLICFTAVASSHLYKRKVSALCISLSGNPKAIRRKTRMHLRTAIQFLHPTIKSVSTQIEHNGQFNTNWIMIDISVPGIPIIIIWYMSFNPFWLVRQWNVWFRVSY